MGHDERRQVVALVAHHDRLLDVVVLAQLVLQGLRGDVLAAVGDDDLLLAVGDLDPALGVHLAHVAGVEVAFRVEHLAGGGLLLPVAEHDVGALAEDLAVLGQLEEGPAVPGLHDGLADVARAHPVQAVEGEDRAGLGEAVALVDGHAHGPEELHDARVQAGPAGDAEAQAPAGLFAHLGEQDPVRQAPGQAQDRGRGPAQVEVAHHPVAGVGGPAEHHPAQQSARGDRVAHLGVDLLEDPRHRHEHGRAHLQDVLGHGDQAFGVVDADPQLEHGVVPAGALEDVRQGQHAEAAVAAHRAQGQDGHLHRGGEVAGEIAVGEHGALGFAGGARGVDQGEQVLRAAFRGPGAHLGPARVQGLAFAQEAAPGDPLLARAVRVLVLPVHDHHGAQLRQPAKGRAHLGQLGGAGDQQAERAAVLDDVGGLVGGQGVVDGHAHQPQQRAGEVRHGPLRAVFREDGQPVPAAQPAGVQRQRQPLHPVAQLPVGDGPVGPGHLGREGVRQVEGQGLVEQLGDGLGQTGWLQ